MSVELKMIEFGGVTMKIPEVWSVHTESYTEPDGRECSMIDVSAVEGDPRAFVISYGPMPEGSDALLEAGETYEQVIGEVNSENDDDPICEYEFLGTTGYGFELLPTEDGFVSNFICAEIGTKEQRELGVGCNLFTILATAKSYEDIDDLLDLVEQNISFK